jgi:hypothetical protein
MKAIPVLEQRQDDNKENEDLNPNERTIGESFETQKEAERFLQALLPFKWPWREQTPDFFVDFHVEVVEDGHLSGFEFGVQVKGTKRAKHPPSTRMECKHLVYYRDKARLPVFIVLVDLLSRNAYWLFAQKHLQRCVNKTAVDKQKTFTVIFDPVDSFKDLDRFRKALKDAEHYMRDLYPGTPAAAISAKGAELQKFDPDIGVTLSFDGCEVLHFDPKKPLHYTFHGLNLEGFKSFQAMLDHGDDFEGPVEVTPPDSPLLQKLMPGKNGYVRFKPDRPDGYVQIIVPSTQHVVHIGGKWRVGRKSIRFEGELRRSPLKVELRIDDWLDGTESKTTFETPISLVKWEGQSILRLAGFDAVQSLVSALATRQELIVKYFVFGTNVGSLIAVSDMGKPVGKSVERLNSAINWLAKVRRVALDYGVDVLLPKWKNITHKVQNTVEALDALANGSIREESISGTRFKILASPHLTFPDDNSSPVLGTMKLTGSETFDFFGQEITVSNVEQILANMRLLSTTITSAAKEFIFEGQDTAVLTRRKIAA